MRGGRELKRGAVEHGSGSDERESFASQPVTV
jgi:hypothetical protein